MNAGRQAGLEGFLLGSTAGMLRSDAAILAGAAALTLALVLLLRRPLTLAAFRPGICDSQRAKRDAHRFGDDGHCAGCDGCGAQDCWSDPDCCFADYSASHGPFLDRAYGPRGADFWHRRRCFRVCWAAISAAIPDVPTGPIIVLVGFALFALSLLLAPRRGVMSSFLRHRSFQRRVHLRQGLLAMAQSQPIYEGLTLRLLRRADLVRPDGVPTNSGQARAAKAMLDEARWSIVRGDQSYEAAAALYDGLTDIETLLTPDQITEIDGRLAAPSRGASMTGSDSCHCLCPLC